LLLAERYPGLQLFGHDQSAYLISLARERALQTLPQLSQRNSLPVFSVGDCRSVPYESSEFDFVMIMGNSFGYFSANDVTTEDGEVDDGDRAVLSEINRLLKKGGQMVLDLADGDYMRENFSPR
jgi:SAM-dependent methyltransferase